MKTQFGKETGAIAIESILGMTFFAIAILAIMFMSLMIRVQSTMQYAISQTAKEISGYYYVVDKCGLAFGTSTSNVDVDKLNNVIGNAIDFSTEAGNTVTAIDFNDGISVEDVMLDSDISATAAELYNSSVDLSGDLQKQLKGALSIVAKSMLKEGLSNYVAPFICKAVIPKYVSGDVNSTDEMLKSMGIEDGMDGLDFSKSSLLADGRTIQIVVIYKLNTKKLTLGMVDKDLYFKQVATTAAWVQPNDDSGGSLKSVADTAN